MKGGKLVNNCMKIKSKHYAVGGWHAYITIMTAVLTQQNKSNGINSASGSPLQTTDCMLVGLDC